MNFEQLIDDLKKEDSFKKNNLHFKHLKDMDQIKTEFINKKRTLRDKLILEKTKTAAKTEKSDISSAKIESKKTILKEKKTIINNIIENGIKQTIQSQEYIDFIRFTIDNNGFDDNTQILINDNDNALKNILSEKGITTIPTNIKGGLIIMKDKISLNKSLDVIIEKNRVLLEKELSHILF
ncbi:MAG: hypothetical protein K0B02_00275 [DPANN group archaeon]|nr:hypothetical protein [DPANN group archaeon]